MTPLEGIVSGVLLTLTVEFLVWCVWDGCRDWRLDQEADARARERKPGDE